MELKKDFYTQPEAEVLVITLNSTILQASDGDVDTEQPTWGD